jgi:FixJ family two-component response regulator
MAQHGSMSSHSGCQTRGLSLVAATRAGPGGDFRPDYYSYMNTAATLICVVDDDESVRESLPDLLREFGFASKVFASAADFLQCTFIAKTKCLILDIAMPEMTGPELRLELLKRGHDIPTIFITAHADFAAQLHLHERVVGCLTKPFSETALLEALQRALKLQ